MVVGLVQLTSENGSWVSSTHMQTRVFGPSYTNILNKSENAQQVGSNKPKIEIYVLSGEG